MTLIERTGLSFSESLDSVVKSMTHQGFRFGDPGENSEPTVIGLDVPGGGLTDFMLIASADSGALSAWGSEGAFLGFRNGALVLVYESNTLPNDEAVTAVAEQSALQRAQSGGEYFCPARAINVNPIMMLPGTQMGTYTGSTLSVFEGYYSIAVIGIAKKANGRTDFSSSVVVFANLAKEVDDYYDDYFAQESVCEGL